MTEEREPLDVRTVELPIGEMSPHGEEGAAKARVPLTRELVDAAADIVARGNFRDIARKRLGVPAGTWRGWINRGRKEIEDWIEGRRETVSVQAYLVQQLDIIEGDVHDQCIEDVLESGDVKAIMWYLERRYNKLYTRNPNAVIDDETGEESSADVTQLLADRLAQALGVGDGSANS